MNKIKFIKALLVIVSLMSVSATTPVYAATTPSLGTASTFGILTSTFTRNIGVTAITGDLGYTTISGSGTSTVTGTTYVPSPAQAGADATAALGALNAEACDFSFGVATDLSLLPQPLNPGVYCITGAQSVGTGGITLSGAGTFIFRSTGALNTVASSVVTLTGGASACDVFWAPTATTLGANSTFIGTDIDAGAITVGNQVVWTGRALLFAGTVTTDTGTITVPTCIAPTATPTPTVTPTPTPTTILISTTNSTLNSGEVSSQVGTSECPAITNSIPQIIESNRIDNDSIFIKWAPYSGKETFNVSYGVEEGKWLYSASVTGFSTTLNDLPPNQPLFVRIAVRNNCSIGSYGETTRVGGPGLPNSGMTHFEPVYLLIGFILLMFLILLRRYINSHGHLKPII